MIAVESEFPSLMLQLSVRLDAFSPGLSELLVNAIERRAACHSATVADCEFDERLRIPVLAFHEPAILPIEALSLVKTRESPGVKLLLIEIFADASVVESLSVTVISGSAAAEDSPSV